MQKVDTYKGYAVIVGEERVYFEHTTRGENDAICVYHEFGSKYIVDYDMAYCMLPEAREWLDANGYDTSDILG